MTTNVFKVSSSAYAAAFRAIERSMTPMQRSILEAHYRAPGHRATATQLARAVGYDSNPPVNSQYGRLARLLCEELGITTEPRLNVLAGVDPAVRGDIQLILRDKAVEALEQLGWFPNAPSTPLEDPQFVDEPTSFEGTVYERIAHDRTRDRQLREKKIEQARRTNGGRLQCEVPGCGFDFVDVYGSRGEGFMHVHHLRPLASRQEAERTGMADLMLVCANCHAMIHRDGECRDPASLIIGRPQTTDERKS